MTDRSTASFTFQTYPIDSFWYRIGDNSNVNGNGYSGTLTEILTIPSIIDSKHIQEVGQEEKIVKGNKFKGKKGTKPSNVKSELKTPEQIERDKLIKLKHKLNDQGKHKEAAMLNKKIYKHSKKKR